MKCSECVHADDMTSDLARTQAVWKHCVFRDLLSDVHNIDTNFTQNLQARNFLNYAEQSLGILYSPIL